MRTLTKTLAGCGIAALLCFYFGILLGSRIGTRQGETNYHVAYMRPLQVDLYDLQRTIHTNDYGAATLKIDRICRLAALAGSQNEFSALLNERLKNAEPPSGAYR